MSESLKIYGLMLSQPMRTVIAFCKLSNVPYEYQEVSIPKGEHLTEDFARINPHQRVPAIVHGDYNLWESPAIVAYIADAFNVDNQWYPKDIKVRGRINAYLHWHHQGADCLSTDMSGLFSLHPGYMDCLKSPLKDWCLLRLPSISTLRL